MDVKVSVSFKKNAVKAVWAIVLFILAYLFLFLLTVLLTVICVAGGILLVAAKPSFITLLLGVGLGALGFIVLIFLIKFFFKKHKAETSRLKEITNAQEPELFGLIHRVVAEVKTDFPQKVYLSEDVNAGVFYDSSFWSMFMPTPKNLQIGLGLINSVTEQELEAILAHEFGHFSQHSMKIGSYVYHTNQIIYNMLYDNESFDNMMSRWAQVNAIFSFFVMISATIIRSILQVLLQVYNYLNIRYLALSREMEFHADEVAAHVAGSDTVKEALLRTEMSAYAYHYVISFYENKIPLHIRSENIYREQAFILNFMAEKNGMAIKNDFPSVSLSDYTRYNKSKLIIKDQWASHPDTKERIEKLEKQNLIFPDKELNMPAMSLFSNREEIETAVTDELFSRIDYKEEVVFLGFEDFKKEVTEYDVKNSYPEVYNGYYDNIHILPFNPDEVRCTGRHDILESLLGNDKAEMAYGYMALENDIRILKSIAGKESDVKTFDYAGQKYKSRDAGLLVSRLEKELENLRSVIVQNDINVYCYFYKLARKNGLEQVLTDKYIRLFEEEEAYSFRIKYHEIIMKALDFLNIALPFEKIRQNFGNVSVLETELKNEIKKMLGNESLKSELSEMSKNNYEKYVSCNLEYFHGISYDDENLHLLFSVLNDFQYLAQRSYFLNKSDLLSFQSELL